MALTRDLHFPSPVPVGPASMHIPYIEGIPHIRHSRCAASPLYLDLLPETISALLRTQRYIMQDRV